LILTEGAYIERELMMVKVRAVGKEREEMKRMADIFRGRIIDVTDKSYTIELTGDQSKNDAFLEAIERSAILETVRPVQRHWARRACIAGLNVCSVRCACFDRNLLLLNYFLARIDKFPEMKVFYDKDCDLSLIKGKTVAIIGYGSHKAMRTRKT